MMKTLQRGGILLMSVLLVAACSELSYQEAMRKNQRRIEDPEKLKDANFLVEAASLNILQRELGDLAASKGYAAAIVEMAKEVRSEHEDLARDLKNVARRAKIKLPAEMNEEHTKLLDELKASDKDEFDRTFLSSLKQANEETIDSYSSMATEADVADIRAFTARRLDIFKTHARRIDDVEKDLLNTYSGFNRN